MIVHVTVRKCAKKIFDFPIIYNLVFKRFVQLYSFICSMFLVALYSFEYLLNVSKSIENENTLIEHEFIRFL